MILVFNYKENYIFLFVGYDKIFNYMVLNSYLNWGLGIGPNPQSPIPKCKKNYNYITF